MSEEKTIPQLLEELEQAGKTVDQRRTERDETLKRINEEETTAHNRLVDAENIYNGIAKRLDTAIEKLKAASPLGTAWREMRDNK
jgi:hypothetical protein